VVCWSVCLSVTIVSPAKTAELIEMPFGMWTRVSPRDYVLDGLQIPNGKQRFCGGWCRGFLVMWLSQLL